MDLFGSYEKGGDSTITRSWHSPAPELKQSQLISSVDTIAYVPACWWSYNKVELMLMDESVEG